MNYQRFFEEAIDQVHAERRYRVFADLERIAGSFPRAIWRSNGHAQEITVWCSNDYLGMGQHPDGDRAMQNAAGRMGSGAGGTRNISGTNHPLVELELELADLHGKEAALVFTSGFVSNEAAISTIAQPAARLPDPLRRAQPRLDDRGRAPLGRREEDLPPQRRRPSREPAAEPPAGSGPS